VTPGIDRPEAAPPPAAERPSAHDLRTRSLQADCASCAGLCCVALAFTRSGGFGFDKEAGEPCVNLEDDNRCRIHPVLRERGFPGCTVFDCQGTGQKITQVTFGGRSWRDEPESRELMFVTFQVMRPLHELLWYLNDALARPEAQPLEAELTALYEETDELTRRSADDVLAVDVRAQRDRVDLVLTQASSLVRAAARDRRVPSRAARRAGPGAELLGADLEGADLRGVNLRGAHLIAANLRGADLAGADLIGADLRDTDVSGADLSGALYFTQFQANSARGDGRTRLPGAVSRPSHWAA
jgi:uncharacterized protein YjbI with pentapeptide repeats